MITHTHTHTHTYTHTHTCTYICQRWDVATIAELRENSQQQEARWQDLDLECGKLRVEVQRAHEITELECYRAVAAECQKWEAREERMTWQLQRLEAAELLRAQVTPGEDSGAVTSVNEECGSHYENRQRSTETSSASPYSPLRRETAQQSLQGVLPHRPLVEMVPPNLWDRSPSSHQV